MQKSSRMLSGRQVLLVEDDYLIAVELKSILAAEGAEVVGPAATVGAALELLDGPSRIDSAVLDLNLRGEFSFQVADRLMDLNVPFIFATGYDASVIPGRFSQVERCEKPIDAQKLMKALFR